MMHKTYLLDALNEAKKGRGFCAPNPAVGALLLHQSGDIVAKGFHRAFGAPHAEADLLDELSLSETAGGTLYVTLEPCCHQGKTPPCVELIVKKNIAHVIYGFDDPNPLVAGKGAAFLREHGVNCEKVSLPEIDAFYKSYSYWLQNKRPWVTAKLALSLDGKIAGKDGTPVKITGSKAKRLTHQCRKESDAILTTVKALIADNPMLNARLDGDVFEKKIYVLDRTLQFPLSANVIKTSASVTLFYDIAEENSPEAKNKIEALTHAGIRIFPLITDPADVGYLNLNQMIEKIGAEGVHDLWIEAGGQLVQQLIQKQLVNRLLFYVAPKTLGEEATSAFTEHFDLTNAKKIEWQQLGNDVMCDVEI